MNLLLKHLGKALTLLFAVGYDPSPFAAIGIYHGMDEGLSYLLGKILECGALCSVAAHTFYEKKHPYILHGPGFTLDLSTCTFVEKSPGVIKVENSKYCPSKKHFIKLEGARKTGYIVRLLLLVLETHY